MLKAPYKRILSCLHNSDKAVQVDDGVGGEYLLQQHLKGVKRVSKMGKVIFGQERKLLGPHLPVVLSRQIFPVLFCHFPGVVSSGCCHDPQEELKALA